MPRGGEGHLIVTIRNYGWVIIIQTYDVIVIGAGPAGSAAARKSAQLGLKTLLLEKEKIPRDKLCGGGLTPKVLKLLDFDLPPGIIESAPISARIHVGKECYRFHSTRPLVYMTSRAKFDMVLSRKAADAGAEVKQEILVQNLAVHHSFVEVHTRQEQFQSRMIIGCDGMGGPTARATGLYGRWAPKEVSYAIESEVPLGEDEVRRFMGAEKYFDVYFGVSPAGYGWIFPKDDHLTVGVGCRLSDLRDAHKIFNDFLNEIPELNGRAIPSPRAHLIPLGGAANVHTVTNRVLLAGDSAGFAEPFLGEGIYFAILGGQIAAEVAREACQKESFDSEFLSMYEERCESAFGIDFDAALRLARLSYLENYDMDRVARIFFPDRRFHECVIELMEGSMRYRDVPAKLAWLYFKYRLSKLGLPVGT